MQFSPPRVPNARDAALEEHGADQRSITSRNAIQGHGQGNRIVWRLQHALSELHSHAMHLFFESNIEVLGREAEGLVQCGMSMW